MTCVERNAFARRVLVIEDFSDLAELLREVLASWGCDVRVASDGVRGVQVARAFRPHVVVCDIGLPRLDGYGVIRALRADPALDGIFAVALTAFAGPDEQRRARAAGFDVYVTKPFRLDTLQRLLLRRDGGEGPPGSSQDDPTN